MNRVIALFALTTAVVASQASMKFTGTAAGQGVQITYGANTHNVFAGKLVFLNTVTNTTFQSVCCDLDHFISVGQTWNFASALATGFGPALSAAGNIVGNSFVGATSNEDAAALQLAVWEATYDKGVNAGAPDFTTGMFKSNISGSLLTKATNYYNTNTSPAAALLFKPTPSDAGQAQLTAVPEPASFIAIGAGISFILSRRNRRGR